MWTSWNSPEIENIKPDDGQTSNESRKGLVSPFISSNENSGASKPCRRPLKAQHLSPNSDGSNIASIEKKFSAEMRSPLKSLYESKTDDAANFTSKLHRNLDNQTLVQSASKDIFSSRSGASPARKTIQRISTILFQRQQSGAVDLKTDSNMTAYSDRGDPSASKSKSPKGSVSKAIRIRLNSSSGSISRDDSSRSTKILFASPGNKKIDGKGNRQSLLRKPRVTINSSRRATQERKNERSISSYDSPHKIFPAKDASKSNNTGKIGFSEALGLVFFSPAETSCNISRQLPSSSRPLFLPEEECALQIVTAISSSVTPQPTASQKGGLSPRSSGGGVSLSRPSMQRSHAKPTQSSTRRDVKSSDTTPNRSKGNTRSPRKSPKPWSAQKALIKALSQQQYIDQDASGDSVKKEEVADIFSSEYDSNGLLDISSDIAFIPEVEGDFNAPVSVLCLSPKRARLSLVALNSPSTLTRRDIAVTEERYMHTSPENLHGLSLALSEHEEESGLRGVDEVTVSMDCISIQDKETMNDPSTPIVKGDCYYNHEDETSSDEWTPQNGSEHVSRVQLRSASLNPSLRGSPFSFPRTMGGPTRVPLTPKAVCVETLSDRKHLADTVHSITASINGISRSLADTYYPCTTSRGMKGSDINLRASMQTQVGLERGVNKGQGGDRRGVKSSQAADCITSSYDEEEGDNSSLCFSADSGVNSNVIRKLPEDSFCLVEYDSLMRAAREERMRRGTPTSTPSSSRNMGAGPMSMSSARGISPSSGDVIKKAITPSSGDIIRTAGPTSWLSLQSPIDKMQQRAPKSALKNSASPSYNLLHTPVPSKSYRPRSTSRESRPLVQILKANGEVLEEGEIDEGIGGGEVRRSAGEGALHCPGLDELLWGPHGNSPSLPLVPNSLSYSTANTPVVHRGPFSRSDAWQGSPTPSRPFSFATPGGYTPYCMDPLDNCGGRVSSPLSRSPSLLGSAVRMSHKDARVTEDAAAADALILLLHALPTSSVCADNHDASDGEHTQESSIFALECAQDGSGDECGSESERSQNQEISAVLKILRNSDVSIDAEGNEDREYVLSGIQQQTNDSFGSVDSHENVDDIPSNALCRSTDTSSNVGIPLDVKTAGDVMERSVCYTEDLDSSAMLTCATTISIDVPKSWSGSPGISTSVYGSRSKRGDKERERSRMAGPQSVPLPCLMVTKKKRRKDASVEMKEIILKSPPGDCTTVALTFGNNRPQVITLRPKAILVRYEPSSHTVVSKEPSHGVSRASHFAEDREGVRGEQGERHNGSVSPCQPIFSVTPESLPLLPDTENVLHVTFSPAADSSGVYSGVLKMRAGNKSFVMLLRGEVQGPSPRPLCAASCSDSDPAHPLKVTNGTSHNGLEGESYVGKYTADDTAGPLLCQSQSSADQALDALTSKRERSQAANPDNLLRVNAFYSPERTAKSSSARREEEEVERSACNTVNVSNAHNSSSVMQQDKVRHWLEMERYRLVGPTIRSGSPRASPEIMRGRSMQRECDVTSTPQHIRHNSSTRSNVQHNDALSSAMESQSVSFLKESSPSRNMGPTLDSSAWRGARIDRPVLSDRAVMTSLSRAQADIERNRKSNISSSSAAHIPSSNLHPQTHTHIDTEILDLRDSGIHRTIPVVGRTVDFQNSEVRRSPVPTLYFRSQVTSFGMTAIGTNSRQKVELCNASSEEVTVYIGDCALPFVVLHNEVTLRPRSFVKIAVRFVPISGPKEYRAQMMAQTADGKHHAEVALYGSSFWS